MHTLRTIRNFITEYFMTQPDPQRALDHVALWFTAIVCAAIGLYLGHRGLIRNLRIARIKLKVWNIRNQPWKRAKLSLQTVLVRARLRWYSIRPRPALRARLLGEIDLMKHGAPGYTFPPHEVMHHPAPHEHTLPPGEEAPMPWCEACKSYHAFPKDKAHHTALQCKATYAPPNIQAIFAKNMAEAYEAGKETSGLPAADLASMPGDPPPPQSFPAGFANVEMIPGQPVPGMPGFVFLNGASFGSPISGFKIEQQPPRQDHPCNDPFCWDGSKENCIHKDKVQWLRQRMQMLVNRALVNAKN